MILGVVTAFLQFARLLSLPTWQLVWMGQPTASTGLQLLLARQGHEAL
jgi:hypothetical protein